MKVIYIEWILKLLNMGINVGPQTNCILLYTLKKDESQYHTIKPGKVIPESGEVILERGKVILERGKVILERERSY